MPVSTQTFRPSNDPHGLLTELGVNGLLAAVRDCVAFESVRDEVAANYLENRWWPTWVDDWRLRMLIAGWSTRVSYNHIAHYQTVVQAVQAVGWERLIRMSDDELGGIVKPLGLRSTRLAYLRSLAAYIASVGDGEIFLQKSNRALIQDIAHHVDGAGYKVAQCAVLYAKGYHCGIIPIDSGLVEMLAPLVPSRLPSDAVRHDLVRQWIEHLASHCIDELHDIAVEAGFSLAIDRDTAPTWWLHLVLIYYKRLYWNRRQPLGPFRRAPRDPLVADTPVPSGGVVNVHRFPGIVLEGIDGSGKTTVATLLRRQSYEYVHAPYTEGPGLLERYECQIRTIRGPTVMDRSFVSEYVYGRVLRGHTRLTLKECLALLEKLAARGFVVFHLDEDVEIAKLQSADGSYDYRQAAMLQREYRLFFKAASRVIPVYALRLSQLAPEYLLRYFFDAAPTTPEPLRS